jgi:creatinine deaminase
MSVDWTLIDAHGLALALAQAKKSYDEGGIPIGSAILVPNSEKGEMEFAVLGCGHNQRIQKSSPILHAEIAALDDAGRLRAQVYKTATIVSPMSRKLQEQIIETNLVHDTKVRS